MRSRIPTLSRPYLIAFLSVSAASCNAIWGLDEVSPRDTTTGQGGASSSTSNAQSSTGQAIQASASGSTGSGGATNCSPIETPNDLVKDGSFEEGGSAWSLDGSNSTLNVEDSNDCDLACGQKIAHLNGQTPTGVITSRVYQGINEPIYLGSSLELSARYTYTSSYDPYFRLNSNGYDINVPPIVGKLNGKTHVVDQVQTIVEDPRRTGNGFSVNFLQDADSNGSNMLVDCISLTHTPPPSPEILANAWADSVLSTTSWLDYGDAQVQWTMTGGLCGDGALRVTIPALSPTGDGEIRNLTDIMILPNTTLRFGGAALPLNNAVFSFEMRLHLEYVDDGNMATADYEDINVQPAFDSEPWKGLFSAFLVKRTTKSVAIYLTATSQNTAVDQVFLADCFSIRAFPPTP